MKIFTTFFAVILCLSTSHAEPLTFELEPDRSEAPKVRNGDYGGKIVSKFEEILKDNEKLSEEFSGIELKALGGEKDGRYMGAKPVHFVLQMSEDVDFGGETGTRDYTQTIVVYYQFTEGFRRGMAVRNGVFAIFEVAGQERYKHLGQDRMEEISNRVTVTFRGFTDELKTKQEDAPDTSSPPC